MKPEAVVFDLGNVLVEWNPEAYYDARLGRTDRLRMFRETGLLSVNAEIDAGAPLRETIYALADRHPEWSDHIRLFHDDQFAMTQPVIWHSVRLVAALRARGVPVFALSNWGDDSFDRALGHYPFLGDFDRHYISGKLKLMKPDPRIYAHVEEDCGIAPEGLLFIDDRAENIEAARRRGWQGHVFKGPEPLALELVGLGLLGKDDAR
jgi:2-haloacid dehalogenase